MHVRCRKQIYLYYNKSKKAKPYKCVLCINVWSSTIDRYQCKWLVTPWTALEGLLSEKHKGLHLMLTHKFYILLPLSQCVYVCVICLKLLLLFPNGISHTRWNTMIDSWALLWTAAFQPTSVSTARDGSARMLGIWLQWWMRRCLAHFHSCQRLQPTEHPIYWLCFRAKHIG